MNCHAFHEDEVGSPRATVEHIPFIGHRNCAQWGPHKAGFLGSEMSEAERRRDAREGSAKLGAAIKKAQRG